MHRLLAGLGVAALVACGSSTDDRPRTLEYVTAAIIVPHCANAECHSAFKHAGVPNSEGYALDTVDAVNLAATQFGLVQAGDPDNSLLYSVLRRGEPGFPTGDKLPRMPYDTPLPRADIDLIGDWILMGADGLHDVPVAP